MKPKTKLGLHAATILALMPKKKRTVKQAPNKSRECIAAGCWTIHANNQPFCSAECCRRYRAAKKSLKKQPG